VSRAGDNGSAMPLTDLLDDETIEKIVVGDDLDARFDRLVAFARHMRALGDGPPPSVSPALEAALAGLGVPRHRRAAFAGLDVRRHRRAPSRRRSLAGGVAKIAGLGLAAQVGLGASVAAAGVVAAGAGGVLPGTATDRVRHAIEAVTPIDFGGSGASNEPARQDDPGRFGDGVSRDATGESDRDPGVDGGEISNEAPGAAHRPAHADPGENRGRAAETPAGQHDHQSNGQGASDGAAGSGTAGGPGDGTPSGGDDGTGDQPSRVGATPGATAPGGTVPERTATQPQLDVLPSSTIPPSATVGTATTGDLGAGRDTAAEGG
jgi:hypothetical protein